MAECSGKCHGIGSGLCWHGHRFQVSTREFWTIQKSPECCPTCPKDKVQGMYQTPEQSKADRAARDKAQYVLKKNGPDKTMEDMERL